MRHNEKLISLIELVCTWRAMVKKIQEQNLQVVYGVHPVIELLKAKKRRVHAVYTTRPEPKAWTLIKSLLPSRPVTLHYADRNKLANLAGSPDHQGVIAMADPFVLRKKPFDPEKYTQLLMLDGIQDTRNLGAILRSAYCTGMNGVVLTQRLSAPINASTLKASAGLAEHLEIYQAPSAAAAALELTMAGYKLFVAALEKGTDARKVAYTKPFCIVIGSEGHGVSHEVVAKGTVITLPQKSADISYNASVAAGILMFLVTYSLTASNASNP